MLIKEILLAVAKAFDAFKEKHEKNTTCEKLFGKFLFSLKNDLPYYDIRYDFLCGCDTASVDGVTDENYIPKAGDAIILDASVKSKGIWCDVTRTFFVGEPTEEQREVYDIVKNALLSTEKILKAGVKACEIHGYMREQLKPYENTFFHHAGHRIGTRRLLQPQFLPNKTAKLKVGDIVTLEPGIYIKDKFGVRLENDYLITESGYEKLFNYPLAIENFIIRK